MSQYLNVFQNKTVVITGNTGFKGSWLALWLSQLGAKVIGISDAIPTSQSPFESAGLERNLEDRRLDIRNFAELCSQLKEIKPNFIFHLAAQPLVRSS